MIGSIIFYDFKKMDLKGWVEFTLSWMRENGFEPNSMALTGRSKYMTFNGGYKILKQENYNLSYVKLHAGGEAKTDAGWKFASSYDIEDQTAFICFDESIIHFNDDAILNLTTKFNTFCNSKYGFSFLRSSKNTPDYYALGLATGFDRWKSSEKEVFSRIQSWQSIYQPNYPPQIYKTGDLRDVYPYNFICQAHLDRIVHGIPLKQFINQPDHGTITPLTDTLWTWKLTSDEESRVREELRDTGILLCV